MPQVKPATSSKLNNNIKNDAEKKTKKDSEAKKKFDAAQDNVKNSQNKKTPKLKIPEFFEASVAAKTNTAQPPLEFQVGGNQASLDKIFKPKAKKEEFSLAAKIGFFENEPAGKEPPSPDAILKPKTKKEKFSLAAKIDFFEKKAAAAAKQENGYSFNLKMNSLNGQINLAKDVQKEIQQIRKKISRDDFKAFIDGRLKDWKEKYTENDADQTVIITRKYYKEGDHTNGVLKNGDDAEKITGLLSAFDIVESGFVYDHDKNKDGFIFSNDDTKELPFNAIQNAVTSKSAEILRKDEESFSAYTRDVGFHHYLSVTQDDHYLPYTKLPKSYGWDDHYEDLYSETFFSRGLDSFFRGKDVSSWECCIGVR
ncbi:MAG: hypothetical protein V4691_06585 [Pseudomonadota bacterium]